MSTKLWAANPAGGSIKYTYVGPGTTAGTYTYYVEAFIYQDCQSLSSRPLTMNLSATCSTGGSQTFPLNYIPYVAPTPHPYGGPYAAITLYGRMDGEEVSDLCDNVLDPSKSPVSSCRSGTIPGYIKFLYAGNITIGTCNYWTLGLNAGCCRSLAVNANGSSIYLETRLNNLGFPTNSSPDFSQKIKPFPTGCVNQPVSYGAGAVDLEGDSLVYGLTCSKTSASNCVTYRPGYSAQAPVPGFTMDSLTGAVSFTPKITGKIIVTFWVIEYERCTGKWKGQTLRDVMFVINSCTNKVPKDVSGISNLKGDNVVKLSKYSVQVCNGEVFSFSDTIEDPDATDTLLFKSNHDVALPGSVMQVTRLKRNQAVVNFSWRAQMGNNPLRSFFLEFNDDACTYPGHGLSVFEIEIVNSTNGGEDVVVCKGVDTAYFEATGGRLYQWRSIWGDSLIWSGPNRNTWGDTTATDTNKTLKVVVNQTTRIEVWSDLNEGCRAAAACYDKDTVEIKAVANYNITSSNDTLICFQDSTIQLFTQPDSSQFGFKYQWSPSNLLNYDSVRTPDVTPIRTTDYLVTVTSDSGCIKYDTIQVAVTTPMPDSIWAYTNKPTICAGDSAQLLVGLGLLPSSCGTTQKTCTGTLFYQTSTSTANFNGNGATGTANWPCPYGGKQGSSRQQYLYTAAELNAMGVRAGIIEALGFNVVALNGIGTLKDYTIKLKCVPTTVTSLNSWQLNGMTTVFTPKNVTVSTGWNLHQLDNNYSYDGVSNLVVEICYDNGIQGVSNNASVAYVTTTFSSCIGYMASSGACSSQFLSLLSRFNRPTLQMEFCGARDSSEFTYQWTPSLGLNNDSIYDPKAGVLSQRTYKVVVTDTFKKCFDSAFVSIDVTALDIKPDTAICPGDSIELTANLAGSCSTAGSYSWSPGQWLNDSTLQSPKAGVTQTTTFTVNYTDPCGCNLVDSITVYADSIKPTITKVKPACGASNGEFHISSNGQQKPYIYSIDSGKTFSLDSAFLNVAIGFYNIVVQDSNGCRSDIYLDTLLSSGAPTIDTIFTNNLSCFESADGIIDIRLISALPGSSYSVDSGMTWQAGTQFINQKAGNYVVFARGPNGCISLPQTIALTQPDSIGMDLKPAVDSCYQLGNGWASIGSWGGTGKHSYTWTGQAPGASHTPVVITDSLYTSLFAFNGYKITITDSIGCTRDSVFQIDEVDQLRFDSIASEQTTCFGYDDGTIFVEVSGGNFTSGPLRYQFSADSGKTFVGPTFSSHNNRATLNKTINGFTLSAKGHRIEVKDSKGCLADTVIQVGEPPKVELNTVIDSVRICVSTCTKLEAFANGGNSTNYTYHWTPTVSNSNIANVCPEKDEVYSVYATDNKGCASNFELIKVDLFDSLRVDIIGDTAICDGEFAQLIAEPNGGMERNYEYLWSPFNDLSSAFIANPKASPLQDQTYFVKLSDSCGSTPVSDSIFIRIKERPKVSFEADSLTGCPPHLVNFKQNTLNYFNCWWRLGDGSIVNTCNPIEKEYSVDGHYDVTLIVQSSDGCVDSLTKKNLVEVFPLPESDFSFLPETGRLIESEIQFYDESSGIITKWEWNFGGLDTSMKRNPSFRFPDNKVQDYLTRLDVTTNKGCTDYMIQKIPFEQGFYIYIPNSFTPNNDGINDVWKPVITGFEFDFYQVRVFDRWGKVLFESSNADDTWDGFSEGEAVPVGSYVYSIVVGDAKDEKSRHQREGNLIILE